MLVSVAGAKGTSISNGATLAAETTLLPASVTTASSAIVPVVASAPTGTLPNTGLDTPRLALLATAMVGAGLVLVVGSRRRRRRRRRRD